MVDSFLVNEIWSEVSALRGLLTKYEKKPSVEALFVNDEGDWRLVELLPGIEKTGIRPIFAALDDLARRENVDVSLLSRLLFVDSFDGEANRLSFATVSLGNPPKRFDVVSSLLPGYVGAILRRDSGSERIQRIRQLEDEVASALSELGIEPRKYSRFEGGQRPDFVIDLGNDRVVLVEAVVARSYNQRARLRDAAGMANLTGRPVILAMAILDQGDIRLNDVYGVVPVISIDWENRGKEGLAWALSNAERWYESRG